MTPFLMKGDSIKNAYQDYFPVGTAIRYKEVVGADPDRMDLIKRNFSILTAENAFKWESLHPKEDRYDFKEADKIADFARENGFKLWGHVLVWQQQVPDWVFKAGRKQASRELVLSRMREHILTVMHRYEDVIYGWDVVNESISDDGSEFFHPSKWLKTVGEDYVEMAFRYAMEADVDALLCYNDYSLPDPPKRRKLERLLKDLIGKGIRVDTVGFQAHYSLYYPTVGELEKSIRAVVDLGIRVSISEIDMSVFVYEDRSNRYKDGLPDELEKYQGYRYAELMQLFRKWSKDIERVTFWNIYDANNWKNYYPVNRRTDYAGLIDRRNRPKSAFEAVLDPEGYIKRYGKVKRLKPPKG